MITRKNLLFTVTALSALIFSGVSNSQSWTTLSDIKNPRFESTAVQYRDDIYVFNGFGPGIKVESSVEKFDAGTKKWSVIGNTSASVGTGVTHNGVIRSGNEVWMIGGRVGNHPGAVTNKVWKYNLNTEKWSAGPALPVPVAAGGAALVDNKIYWFGGLDRNAQCDVDNHYVYDLGNPGAGWKDISGTAPMPRPRNHFATVVHNKLIYAIGGQFTHDGCGAGTPDTNLVHVFNTATNTWSQKASLPAVQSHIEPSSFLYNNAIYVVGGATSGNKIYRYDPSKNDWDTVGTLPQKLLAPVARVIDGKLIVSTGGAPSIIPSKKTYVTDMGPLLLSGGNNTSNSNNAGNTVTVTDNDPTPAVTNTTPVTVATTTPVNTSNTADTTQQAMNTFSSTLNSTAGLVVLEAEFHDTITDTSTHQWVPGNPADTGNVVAMVTTPDNNTLKKNSSDSPSIGYFAYFDRPGTWYLWVRGWGDTVNNEGGNDSVHAGLNGTLTSSADKIDHFPSGWNWSSSTRDNVRATINIPHTGINTVNLWMREDGLIIDKILLTTDPFYMPEGSGPAHTDGSTSTEEVVDTTTPAVVTPVATSAVCVDTGVIGDGWGWDGSASCRVTSTQPVCFDFDGDGWGWDGTMSCRP